MNTGLDHVACPLSPFGTSDNHIKELDDPTNFSEAVAKTKVRLTHDSAQGV